MKKPILIFVVVFVVLLGGGVLLVRSLGSSQSEQKVEEKPESGFIAETVPENTEVSLDIADAAEANTILLKVGNLQSKYTGIGYEVTYETEGTFQGVNSGSKPIDVTGKDEFTRDVYLGTCSKNVCKPHTGVKEVSIVMQFTDADGQKTQLNKTFPLE